MDWQLGDRVPDARADFEVWLADGSVRKVHHVETILGHSLYFMDCTHPLQNVHCSPARVQAWRLAPPPPQGA